MAESAKSSVFLIVSVHISTHCWCHPYGAREQHQLASVLWSVRMAIITVLGSDVQRSHYGTRSIWEAQYSILGDWSLLCIASGLSCC